MENELANMKQERSVGQSKLQSLIADPEWTAIETAASLDLPATLEPETVLEEYAMRNRPELQMKLAEFEAKDLAHLGSKMNFFPDTDLGLRKRVDDGWDAMVSFTVPLYFWKQGYGVSSAGFEREAAEAEYRNARNRTKWELKEAYVMADSLSRTARLYEQKVLPEGAQVLKVALSAYQTGKFDFANLLQIERMYRETKLKYFEKQAGYGKAIAELEMIIGREIN
jgi:outer membrane protein TolC